MNTITRQAEELALKFRVQVGISYKEPVNAKTLLRKLNILAMYRPLSTKFWGLSTKTADNKYKFILINSNSTRGRQHFTIAHELYHLFYDAKPQPHFCGQEEKDKTEKMADEFASALLMPYEGIMENIPTDEIRGKKISMATILRMEQLYGVSHQSMTIRLKKLGLITEEELQQYNAVSITDISHAYGVDQSLYLKGNDNLTIGDLGLKAKILFDKDKISEGHYIEILNMLK